MFRAATPACWAGGRGALAAACEDVRHLVPLQRLCYGGRWSGVKVGGVVVYSTCSIEPEENGAVVRAVLQEEVGWLLEQEEESCQAGRPTAATGPDSGIRSTGVRLCLFVAQASRLCLFS